MKTSTAIIAGVFAIIAILSLMLGLNVSVLPILSQLGKIAAMLALSGFAITALAYALEEIAPVIAFDVNDIQP
jgi:hypothetical protein